jgi:hypothetical protein
VVVKGHNLMWWGEEMIEEASDGPFKRKVTLNCPGLCNEKEKRRIAVAVAMDCIPGVNRRATFIDIDFVDDT